VANENNNNENNISMAINESLNGNVLLMVAYVNEMASDDNQRNKWRGNNSRNVMA
jgi:hypothetical protein